MFYLNLPALMITLREWSSYVVFVSLNKFFYLTDSPLSITNIAELAMF